MAEPFQGGSGEWQNPMDATHALIPYSLLTTPYSLSGGSMLVADHSLFARSLASPPIPHSQFWHPQWPIGAPPGHHRLGGRYGPGNLCD